MLVRDQVQLENASSRNEGEGETVGSFVGTGGWEMRGRLRLVADQ